MKKILPLIIISLLSGCAGGRYQIVDRESPTKDFEVGDLDFPSEYVVGGSIFSSGSSSLLLGAERSYRVGDIVIVEMEESIDAQDSTVSKATQKSTTTTGAGITLPVAVGGDKDAFSFNLSNDKKVNGSGSTSQSHKIDGSIACTVTKVFPNGVLLIKGTKKITLEKGSETVAIFGHIREQDISITTNTIPSSRIANAKIYYKGEGMIYEKSSEGWLSSFIGGKYWPF